MKIYNIFLYCFNNTKNKKEYLFVLAALVSSISTEKQASTLARLLKQHISFGFRFLSLALVDFLLFSY